jgi:predicted nucleic-acid-binding protein
MIGLDTNVLVRYIVQSPTPPSPASGGGLGRGSQVATAFIERLSERDPGFVSVVAMTETAWVLERAYRLSAGEVAKVIERMLQAAPLVVESEQEVFTAMVALKEGRGSFADALIGALGAKAGCSTTVTFDRRAVQLSGFELLSA